MLSELQLEQLEQKDKAQFQKSLSINTIMSIPFLALNYYDSLFQAIYIVVASTMLIYKNNEYPLPNYALNSEATIITLFIFTQFMRYRIAKNAILTKQTNLLLAYTLASLFILLTYIFQIALQTYVLLIQIATNSIGIVFIFLQIILSLCIFKVFNQNKQLS